MRRFPFPALLLAAAVACNKSDSNPYNYASIVNFSDDAQTNTKVDPANLDLTFREKSGNPVDLKDYRGKKNVVLVMTRGYSGALCPFCTAQTSRLISQYDEFAKRDAEVLVVFPGPKEQLGQFLKNAEKGGNSRPTPFPVLLDENFAAVDKLGIRGQLAKPSTYILDKQGQIRFAYVGATISDRPSVKALLKQLDEIAKG